MVQQKPTYPGQCMLCNRVLPKAQMTRHLKKCVAAHSDATGRSVQLFHLVIEGRYAPMYWMHVEVPGNWTLERLDAFLRHTWLECCGHLSCFTIDGERYSSQPVEDSFFGMDENTMKQKICKVLGAGTKFEHEYDYGSTTTLKLRVVEIRTRQVTDPKLMLLGRNESPAWTCARCKKPATQIRASGWGLDPNALLCDDCVGDEDYILPLVNSPRTGVCAYSGPMGDNIIRFSEAAGLVDDDMVQEGEEENVDDDVAFDTPEVPLDAWRRLYEAADRIKKLAPWQWMEETDVFGVQLPGMDQPGYLSVMGRLGQHYAITVYLGDDALLSFWDVQNSEESYDSVQRICEVPQLMASFEDRDMLLPPDRAVIDRLGLKYRGAAAWPLFRSLRPGFHPWFLTNGEVEQLTVALEQAAGIAMRKEDHPDLLEMEEDDAILVRTTREADEGTEWDDEIRTLADPEPFTLRFAIDTTDLDAIRGRETSDLVLDVGFYMTPLALGEPGLRPAYAYMLLVVEADSDVIMGCDVLHAETGLHRMWEGIPAALVKLLNAEQLKPKEIRFSSPRLYQFMEGVAKELGIELSLYDMLPGLDDAREFLFATMTEPGGTAT